MLRNLIAIAGWALLAFIAYATISHIQYRPTLPISSNFERLAAFTVLGALFCLAYPRRIAFVCLIVLGAAAVWEIVQLLTPDRHGRILDAAVKSRAVLQASWLGEESFISNEPHVGSRFNRNAGWPQKRPALSKNPPE